MAQCIKCGKKGLLLHVNLDGLCDDCARTESNNLKAAFTPEQQDFFNLQKEIARLKKQKEDMQAEIIKFAKELNTLYQSIQDKKSMLVEMDEEVLLQSFGLFRPRYAMCNADGYKDKLQQIRQQQKELIKKGLAVTGSTNWTINGSLTQGQKMVCDTQKLLLRAFNSECDDVIEHVKYNTYDSSAKRIFTSCQSITKLGKIMNIAITAPYYDLKHEELTLALEYQQQKQKEKEEQKELRAQMREEAKMQKEIEEARKKAEKEHSHYLNALSQIDIQIENAQEKDKEELLAKKEELKTRLTKVENNLKDIDYRETNQKAGYVYIISNIGSFGENVYKIGMTRRLDPTERVDELGDASVPFDFDIHAMIFSDNAPALEAALHKAFENKKLNMVNTRREFFNVSLDEIKEVVKKNFNKTAEFVETAAAEQYRISQKMKENIENNVKMM